MAHRSSSFLFKAAVILTAGSLASCASPSAGPQSWLDTPLNSTSAPLAPITIIAHSSASAGVTMIEFSVNGQPYRSVAADGGRLVWRQVEWVPPGPGTYLIGARGIASNGAVGEFVTSVVTVSEKVSLALPSPLHPPTAAVTATPAVTETPETPAAPLVPMVAATINANCREGPGTAYDVYGTLLEGQEAEVKGRLADNSWLWVALTGRSSKCWIAASVVEIRGELAQIQVVSVAAPPPPAAQPPVAQPPPPSGQQPPSAPTEIDSAPPSFYAVGVEPNEILTEGGGCPSKPRTFTVVAVIMEQSGLDIVRAHWHTEGGESGTADMSMGYLGYYAVIGPVHTDGTLEIYVFAQDTLGYASQSDTQYVTVRDCIG